MILQEFLQTQGRSKCLKTSAVGTAREFFAKKAEFKWGIAEILKGGQKMAKDGTARGGARPGSGPKKKPLFDKILAGDLDGVTVLPEPADLDGIEMPKIKDFMKAQQRDGSTLAAPEIFKETWNWLKARGCEKQVNTQLLEEFSMAAARWIQCEEAISQYGLLAKHPTTSAPTMRGSHFSIRTARKTPHHFRSNHQPICFHVAELPETDEQCLVSDFRHCKGSVLG